MDWQALIALDAATTAELDPQSAADELNAPTEVQPVEMRPEELVRMLMDAGELVPVQQAAENALHPDHAEAAQAVVLLRTARDYGMALKLWAGTQDNALLSAVVVPGLISAETYADILAKSQRMVSKAAALGLPRIKQGTIEEARRLGAA